jgi:hypothetical protein
VRSLIADAIMAMTNWKVNGSIGSNLHVQTCRSKLPIFANSCENLGHSFLDITGDDGRVDMTTGPPPRFNSMRDFDARLLSPDKGVPQ